MLRRLIERLASNRSGPRHTRSFSSRREAFLRRRSRGLRVEPLEERALLAGLTIAIAEASISEDGGAASAIVSRDSGTSGDLVVELASDDVNSATVPPTVTIPDGQDSASFTITSVDEAIVDITKTVRITASAAGFDPGSDTLDITNDDRATLSVGNATVVEGDSGTTLLSFPVTLDLPVDVDISVDYVTQDGTATAVDGDYVPVTTPATLTIPAGETSATINIVVNGETKVELDETLSLLLTNVQASSRYVRLALADWVQLGQDINGEEIGDQSGWSVSLSDEGTRIAIGAPFNNGDGVDAGQARVFFFDGINWVQLGQDIDGEATGDSSGWAVSLSGDGRTIVVGAVRNDGNGKSAGHARVYRFDGINWVQLGSDIDGESADDNAGWTVSLSENGNTVVIGSPGTNFRQTHVYRFDGNNWIQLGQGIGGGRNGKSVSISDDGNMIAIGVPGNNGGGSGSGQTRVYRFDGSGWIQLGQDIYGEALFDNSAWSVSLSGGGNTVAIGAPLNDGSGTDSGHARVYRFDGSVWTQLGQDIDGEAAFDRSGWSVSLSNDGYTVAVGAPVNDGGGINVGHARVYRFDGTNWTQLGQDIEREGANAQFGWSVALNGDGNKVLIGVPFTGYSGQDHARFYQLEAVATATITNDDSTLAVEDLSGAEGSSLTFTVALDIAVPGGFTVDVTLTDVTAQGGAAPLIYPSDYDKVVTQLKFSGIPGETHQFTVATLDDSVLERTEVFMVSLNASNPLVDDSDTATGTIANNDSATLRVGNATVTEGDDGTTLLSFPVTLDAAVDVDVSVDYTTQDGTATAGDYIAVTTPTSLTINASDTSGTINLTINGDTKVEPDKTLTLLLTNLQGGGRDVTLADWTQLGQRIDGSAAVDQSGHSVSLSGDGKTLAIGAPRKDLDGSGRTRVFRLDGANWIQLGQDILGEAKGDFSGWSVSLNDDGNTLAIGAIGNEGNGVGAGHTRVYHFDGVRWKQLGRDIDGEAARNNSGHSVSLSGDGSRLAIGAPFNHRNGTGNPVGHARVYRFDGVDWDQLGQDIDGETGFDKFGGSVSLSRDGNTLATGAINNDGGGRDAGQTRVYRFDGVTWTQLGQEIDGEGAGDGSGRSVSLSDDGHTLAIGAPGSDGNGNAAGQARVYRFDGTLWNQLGQKIDGEAAEDLAGESVSLSGDGNTMAIGSPGGFSNPLKANQARVYRFDGTLWTRVGQPILGEATGDRFGASVSLSNNGGTLAIGAPRNDRNGIAAGQARVYRLQAISIGTINDDDALSVEFIHATGLDAESSGANLPQLSVTGTVQAGHSVMVDAAVVGGTATGGGVDYGDPVTVTILAGTYDATPVDITGLSIVPDTLIESDETIEFELLPGKQVQVGDANGDGTVQATTLYTILDDDLQNVRTAVELDGESILTIREFVPGGKDDQLELSIVGDRLVITDRNNILGNFGDNTTGNAVEMPLAAIRGIEIDLAEGDDQITIDFSGAPQGLNLPVTINGGDGHDTLTFAGPIRLDAGELQTDGQIEDIFVNGPITMQSGTIALDAVQSLEVNADISLSTGSIQLTAGRDVFGNCSLIQAGDADVKVVAGTGIGNVRVETTGNVLLDAGSGGVIGCSGEMTVRARTLTLKAGASVGTALLVAGQAANVDPLLTSVDAIQGTVGGLGIFLTNDRPLTDNVELLTGSPMGIRNVCPGPTCGLSEGEGPFRQNSVNRLDVNNDGFVSPVDVLGVFNYLNRVGTTVQSEGSGKSHTGMYVDVNGDRAVSALDALIVINHLNSRTAAQAEGESAGTSPLVLNRYVSLDDGDFAPRSQRPLAAPQRTSRNQPLNFPNGDAWATTAGTSPITPIARHRLIELEDEEGARSWDSLLDAIAQDAAGPRLP